MEKVKNVFGVAGIILFGLIIFALTSSFDLSEGQRQVSDFQSPAYRFVCIYSGSSDDYKYTLQEGINKAAEEEDIWISFHEFKSFEADEHCEELDKAIAAKVDGIITNIPDNTAIEQYIEAASSWNIPVITIENDLPSSKRISFIGTNSYAYGVNAGKLMISAMPGSARTAVFKSPGVSKFNLKNQGFQNTIKDYLNMSTEVFNVQEPSTIEYTNMAQSIFLNNPQIDSFFCSDTESTLGVVRAMIEFNKTDSVVIGSGDSDEILKHVKNRIIFASLVEDPYSTGYLSVKYMLKHKNGENISEVVNPDIIAITKDNIDSILAMRKEKD